MQVAQKIAGYSLGQADILRRAMGKKKRDVIEKEKKPFIIGAVKNGFREADAARIYDILVPFAEYGFNKSHSAAYAILAYQTAYLKANFPAEFMAANLTNEINSTDKLPEYIDEARKMGIPIDPPDINRSDKLFTVVDGRIVYGLKAIKGIGDKPAEEIIRCRQEGPYQGFIDFLNRVDIKTLGKKVIELLVMTGALDCFGMSRELLAGNLERAVEYADNIKEDKKYGQTSLFGDTGEKEYPDFEFQNFPEAGREERLKIEKELIGFYFSGHPMDDHRQTWEYAADLNLARLDTAADGSYTLVGIIKTLRIIHDKNGKEMCFASLQDYNGEADLVFFTKTWEKYREEIIPDRIVALRGILDRGEDKKRARPSFKVNTLLDIDKLAKAAAREAGKAVFPATGDRLPDRLSPEQGPPAFPGAAGGPLPEPWGSPVYPGVHITLRREATEREENLYPLLDYLEGNTGPCPVFIHVPLPEGETIIQSELRITAEGTRIEALTRCNGVANVWQI
jgi:DNA polymerase-3 subunit alpha